MKGCPSATMWKSKRDGIASEAGEQADGPEPLAHLWRSKRRRPWCSVFKRAFFAGISSGSPEVPVTQVKALDACFCMRVPVLVVVSAVDSAKGVSPGQRGPVFSPTPQTGSTQGTKLCQIATLGLGTTPVDPVDPHLLRTALGRSALGRSASYRQRSGP